MTVRTIQTETPYIFRVDVPFTGVATETALVYTDAPLSVGSDRAVEVLGIASDIVEATALFTLNGRTVLSSDQIPLAMNAGTPGSAKPVMWLERVIRLGRGQRIRGDLINVAGEGAGTLYFIARREAASSPQVMVADDVGEDDALIIESGFEGVADEAPARATSPIIEEDFLVYGLHTNLNNATIRMFGIDGIPWSEDALHTWAIAGRAGDEVKFRRLHKPYLIPAGNKVSAEFINGSGADVDAAGQLFLKGLRFPALHQHQ